MGIGRINQMFIAGLIDANDWIGYNCRDFITLVLLSSLSTIPKTCMKLLVVHLSKPWEAHNFIRIAGNFVLVIVFLC